MALPAAFERPIWAPKRSIISWSVLWALAIILDAWSTWFGMTTGFTEEANVYAAAVMGEMGTIPAIAALSVFSGVFAVGSLIRPSTAVSAAISYTSRFIGVVKLAVALSNVWLLLTF
jgi:hypothetical protein